MKVERIENIILSDNDSRTLADFLDLLNEIDREVVDLNIKRIIKNINQDINELENYFSYE